MRSIASTAAILAMAATVVRADDNAPAADQVTFAKDIAPLLYANCADCHRPGQIAPMSFMTYDEVRPWAKSIKKSVADRTMPPWHADPTYGHFENDMSMSEEEVAKFVKWVDQGAPAGDLASAPPQPTFEDATYRFGKPDEIFIMDAFQVPDDIVDHYEHIIIENKNTVDRNIIATEIRSGAASMVHHVLVFLVPKGMEVTSLFEDPKVFMNSTFLTGWGPGTNPLTYPEGYGKVLPADKNLMFQVHYHKEAGPGTGAADRSSMAVKYSDEPVKNPTTTAWVMDPTIAIPPNNDNYESVSIFKFMDDGHILGLVPHMHLRGKDFSFTATYPDGSTETLLSVPRYDFNWQIAYTYEKPKEIPKGTVIRAIAHYNNSTSNPANPDPDSTIYFGEATTDEMMIGFMEYSYVTRKNSQAKFGLPEGMQGFGMFGGGGSGGQHSEEFMKKLDERRERIRKGGRHGEEKIGSANSTRSAEVAISESK